MEDMSAGLLGAGIALAAADVCPVEIWAEVFARHRTVRRPLNDRAMLNRELPLLVPPETDRLRSHMQQLGDIGHPATQVDSSSDRVHPQILHS